MPRLRVTLASLIAFAPSVADAAGDRDFYGYAYQDGGPGYPLSLPQTLRATVTVPLDRAPAATADTLAELYPMLAACWRPPAALDGAGGIEITARLSLRRDGSLLGVPRITYATGVGGETRPALVRATLDGLRRCLPAPITPALGRAIAGRPVALRFVYRRAAPHGAG
ncbi:hypothetical protein [uncultured Methylobacterium sp.]|uniref:hypothetical protein n=1 Tax=uncultured Methylobacterium sp. TaxID=157278 RepID=UPI0035CB05C8